MAEAFAEFLLQIALIIGIISFISKASRKKAAKKRPPVRQTPKAQPTQTGKVEEQSADGWEDERAFSGHRGRLGELHPTERSTLSFEQTAAQIGNEGEDACHAYMLNDSALPLCPDEKAETAFAPGDVQSELVRGVIMAEILKRPTVRLYVRRLE